MNSTKNLQFHNPRFITYADELLTIDVLGGVDTLQIERMICTLRITYQSYAPLRSTLDLYSDTQTDKLIRTLCDKWNLPLSDASTSVHTMTAQLESYKLEQLQYPQQKEREFEPSEQERGEAVAFLKDGQLLDQLIGHLNTTGILGEDENAVILFLALASYKFSNPFSVICLAKSGIGKSYILQKLSECMPSTAYSFHTQLSENALYYFDSHRLDGKALFIEHLEWTPKMLTPLATLQTQGRLAKTRATKDKDGMLHSTTFEVNAKLCLLACAYSDKNFEQISLPFLCLHLNHSHSQDVAVMEYQKRCKAGQVKTEEVKAAQQLLKCVIATLENVRVINPYATLIDLPDGVAYPRKSLLLLLDFIEVITYFFQYQREQCADESTGELLIKTHPVDIELAFKYLKNNLFRRADELSASARGFYNWLNKYLQEAQASRFCALDIRKAKRIHPRTLNRYLQELKLFGYLQITGGNKHREGFIYKLSGLGNQNDTQNKIEQSIATTLKTVWNHYHKEQQEQDNQQQEQGEQKPIPEPKYEPQAPQGEDNDQPPAFFDKDYKRIRINEKEAYTFKLLMELEAEQPGREYISTDITALSKRSQGIEGRYLKTLWQQGKLTRQWRNRQYYYKLATQANTTSKPVSQNPVSDTQNPDN